MLNKKKIQKKIILLGLTILILCQQTGCKKALLDSNKPVTITMWHNFGGNMQQTMDEQITEFNNTIGKKKGIIVNVTAISSSSELQQNLDMIANEDPGAPDMPDLMTCYPKTAIQFQKKGKLVNFHDFYNKEELSKYVPQFLEEGTLEDGGIYVFPIAKSTEILYLNQTFFDEFSAATGVTMDCFDTFEGIMRAAQIYYDWTDSQTPDIENDGKAFFCADSWLNLTQASMLQLGDQLFTEKSLNLHTTAYQKIFTTLYQGVLSGGFTIYDGYSSDLAKSGELICSTGSSAGLLFYGDTVTYADNTTKQVEYTILPYPIMENSKKYVIQRGNGMCIAKSTPQKEYAASIFVKWFTSPEQNKKFVSSTGYLPVNKETFDDYIEINNIESSNKYLNDFIHIANKMYQEYEFFVAPTFDEYNKLSKEYETELKAIMRNGQLQYDRLSAESDTNLFLENGYSQLIENLKVGGN